jgi:hypothetical protein
MGCISSQNASLCDDFPYTTKPTLLSTQNELSQNELSLNDFTFLHQKVLGFGGFGIVRLIQKSHGHDKGTSYAMKSLNKCSVLKRPSGSVAVLTELKCLVKLEKQQNHFICNINYAFQDDAFLYMVNLYCIDMLLIIRMT